MKQTMHIYSKQGHLYYKNKDIGVIDKNGIATFYEPLYQYSFDSKLKRLLYKIFGKEITFIIQYDKNSFSR